MRSHNFLRWRRGLIVIVFAATVRLSVGLQNCTGEPCMYGICMNNDNGSYSCYCIDGYTGINCEINWNDCWSDPCLNGGTCNDAIASYNCTCPDGFVGINCEEKYSECMNQPCLNNGTCIDYNGFMCQCPEGYSGDYCEIDASVCNNTICRNSGECVEGPGFSFSCRCTEGWTGRYCEDDVNECLDSPCHNGGLCLNVPATYTCACLFGFTGKDCDKAIVPCDENPCKNEAMCLLEDSQPVCYCVPDYHGQLCEQRYDDCESKFAKCENGGTCIDGINNFTCSCPVDYYGEMCHYYNPTTTTTTVGEPETTLKTVSLPTMIYQTSRETTTSFHEEVTTRSFHEDTSLRTQATTQEISTRSTVDDAEIDLRSTVSTISTTSTILHEPKTGYFTETSVHPDFETPSTTYSPETQDSMRTESKSFLTPEGTTEKTLPMSETPELATTTEFSNNLSTLYGKTDDRSTTSRSSWNETSQESLEPREETLTSPSIDETSTIETTMRILVGDTTRLDRTNETTPSVFDVSRDRVDEDISSVTPSLRFFTTPESESTTGPATEGSRYNCSREECVTSCRNSSKCDCESRARCSDGPSIGNAAFNGKSYVRQQVSIDPEGSLRIFIRLKTKSKSGILVHAFFDDERYVLLYMEGGQLKFQFSCGLQTMLLGEIDSPINNGYDVDVEMRFQYSIEIDDVRTCSAILLVNETMAMSGKQLLTSHEDIPRQVRVHLGGIPQAFTHYFPRIAMGFIGCMSILRVNDAPRHFIHDSTETYQIEECTSFLCLINPCRNFGSCHDINGQVYCKCIAGFSGAVCERTACDDNPCYLGATCISAPGAGFICVCPLGMHGLLCEEESTVVQPSFSVFVPGFSSYAAYGLTNAVRDAMELRMRFVPHSLDQISLIAFMGQTGPGRTANDHFSITYVRGYIMLTWDLGSGVRRIFTKTPLRTRAHRPHTLQVGRRGREAWLSVDGLGNVTGQAAGTMTQLDVSPILYVGGHKSRNFETLPHDLPLHTGFYGCIFDIELKTDQTIFPVTKSSPATGRGVGECHRNECSQNACKNGALCLNHGPTYSCVCMKEWEGADCSVPAVTCSSSIPYKCQKANVSQ